MNFDEKNNKACIPEEFFFELFTRRDQDAPSPNPHRVILRAVPCGRPKGQ